MGTNTLLPEGFSVGDGRHERLRRRWDEVGEFFVARAFRSPVYQGKEAPHVRFLDGSVDWLPQNGGYSATAIVDIMEGGRRLSAAGWPILPNKVEALSNWAEHGSGERDGGA